MAKPMRTSGFFATAWSGKFEPLGPCRAFGPFGEQQILDQDVDFTVEGSDVRLVLGIIPQQSMVNRIHRH